MLFSQNKPKVLFSREVFNDFLYHSLRENRISYCVDPEETYFIILSIFVSVSESRRARCFARVAARPVGVHRFTL